MISKLKQKMLDKKVLKQIKLVRKDIISRGDNPTEVFTEILNGSVKEWIDDAPSSDSPFEFLMAGMAGTIDMCKKMHVSPADITDFPRMVNRIVSMAKARGLEVEVKTNIPGIKV